MGVLLIAGVNGDVVAAQLPTPNLPAVPDAPVQVPEVPSVPLPQAPAPNVPLPQAPAPSVPVPKVPVPAPTVPKVPLPQAPAPTVPKVPVPKLPAPTVPTVPKVPAPKLPVPGVQVPKVPSPGGSLPDVSVPGVSAPKVPKVPQTSLPGTGRTSSPGSGLPGLGAVEDALSGAGTAAGAGAVGGSVAGVAAFAMDPNSPAAQRLRGPAARRLRQAWDAPLRGEKLRRLRRVLAEADAEGCLGALPRQARRILILRSGLGRGGPASRRVIARRVGLSVPVVIRVERVTLRALRGASAGECSAAGAAGAAAGVAEAGDGFAGLGFGGGESSSSPADSPSDGKSGADAPRSDVRGISASGGPEAFLDPFDEVAGSNNTDAFLILLGALGILALGAAAMALRSGAAPMAVPLLARRPVHERPLLFLDVDGVLALSPLAPSPPPGNVYYFGMGALYVPDRAGELVRELDTRFQLVWATGWEQHANQSLRLLLGLQQELPVISFGGKARFGSAEWKTKAISRYAGNRPAAWLDDNFDPSHEAWVEHRKAPTLLIPVDRGSGLSEDHVDQLTEWADRLESPAKPVSLHRPARETAS